MDESKTSHCGNSTPQFHVLLQRNTLFFFLLKKNSNIHFRFLHSGLQECTNLRPSIPTSKSFYNLSSSFHRRIFFIVKLVQYGQGDALFLPTQPSSCCSSNEIKPSRGTSTQEWMGPISMLSSPKRQLPLLKCVKLQGKNKHAV